MSNKFKDIDIENRTYYFFDDIINIENFDPNKVEGEENSYYIGYTRIKDLNYITINSIIFYTLLSTK